MRSGSGAPASPGRRPASSSASRPVDHPELAESVELAGGLRRHPLERVEVVDLGRDLAAERRRVEAIDPLDRRLRPPETGPEGVDAGADRRHDADAGDPDRAVDSLMPLVSSSAADRTVRRSATASARALNVASVRPAIGRVNARSTNRAKPGRRGEKSCSIVTRQTVAPGSIGCRRAVARSAT